jgi:hypothetical protein
MTTSKQSFEEVWISIVKHEGKIFHTKRGYPFTYSIHGTSLRTDRTSWALNNKNLKYAYDLWPVSGPGKFNYAVRGPSYAWAIFSDERIIKKKEDET